MKDVIAICTLDRPNEVGFLTKYLRKHLRWDGAIVVVDASQDKNTRVVLETLASDQDLILLSAPPGLPSQRNVALGFVRQTFDNNCVIHFLDDDVIPSSSYFSGARSLIRESSPERPVIVGSQDLLLSKSNHGRILSRVGLKGRDGRVSVIGLSSPPVANSRSNQWNPGHGLSFRPADFPQFEFDPSINFFGEDIEATLRLGQSGDICLAEGSKLLHVPGPRHGGRLMYDLRELELRMLLAIRFPSVVKKPLLLVAMLLEGFALLILPILPARTRVGMINNRLQMLLRKH